MTENKLSCLRKLFKFFWALVIIGLFTNISNAYTETSVLYEFPDFSVRIPKDYFVFTPKESADIFTFDDGLVFGAINTNTMDELSVKCIVENPSNTAFNSLDNYDDEKLIFLCEIIYPELVDGADSVNVYRHPQTPFVVCEGYPYEEQGHTIIYFTQVKLNNKTHWLSITGVCRTKEKSNAFAKDLLYIVGSLDLVEYPDFEMPELPNDKEDNKTIYRFPELFVEFALPNNLYVLTKDISPNDELLNFLGMSVDEVLAFLKENNRSMDAFDEEFYYEIMLSSRQSTLIDLINTEDSVFSIFAAPIIENYKTMGLNVYQHTVLKHHQAKFLKLYGHIESQDASFLEYITVMNGQEISLLIRINDEAISKAAEAFADEIVFGIEFQDMNEVAAQHYETINSFDMKYVSEFTLRNGIKFKMLKEEIISLEREIHDVEPFSLATSESILYSRCNVENYTDGDIKYNFNSDGELYHVEFGLGWEDEPDRISIVKNNYTNISAEMERRYGAPRNQNDGLVFPLISDTLDGWITTPYCIQGYKQWLIECKDYYVLAEIVLTKTSSSSIWRCDASYTMYGKEEVLSVLDKNRRIF